MKSSYAKQARAYRINWEIYTPQASESGILLHRKGKLTIAKSKSSRLSYSEVGKSRTITLIVHLITFYDYCIFLDPPLILGVIKFENLRLKKIQRLLNLTKALHRLVIEVFKCNFTTEFASLLYLRNFAILQDSCKTVRR